MQQRLQELEFRPFKPGSKNQPNVCAKIIIAGNHERTMEMAFGSQTVNAEKGADNSHLRRCREVEEWAIDSYRWCCDQFGQENVIGFQVHLDEKSPHCHALIDENRQLNQTLQTLSDNFDRFRVSVIRIFDVLAVPDLRERLFTIAYALIGGRPIPLSAVGGGGDSSDLRWDGRRPDEEENAYRYRCLIKAAALVTNNNTFRRKR